MTPEEWQRVEEILGSALDLEPAQRAPFLEQACGSDQNLLREVETLLAHDVGAGAAIANVIGDVAASLPPDDPEAAEGERIGVYRVVRQIGRGGMGTVYLAERADGGFRQQVAIKLMQRGLNEDFGQRFLQERQILAGLVHPNIARLLDGGARPDGAPYFVMEYVEGVPIDKYCEPLTITERLKLFQSVCDAVEYAHRNLVVHRDIKPGNILVTAEGAVKLLDFGIAKLLASPVGDATVARLMSLDYASPEQVRCDPITTATDIYSLGAVLYTLLTGKLPHGQLSSSSPFDVERAIVEVDTARPSLLRPDLEKDLDAIVLKAMRKEPERRYASVGWFSEDVRCYLTREPVKARQGTLQYRAGKFLQRHRVAVPLAAAALLALGAATGIAIQQARNANRRFEQVRRLAGSFLFDFENSIHTLPGSTSARHLVVKTGLEYLESLAKDAGNDRVLLRELADGYRKIADVQNFAIGPSIGDSAGALASHQKAQAIREKLGAASVTADPVLRREYIQGWLQMASVQGFLADAKGERASVEKAIALVQASLVRNPQDLDMRHLDGSAHLELSRLEKRTGSLKPALEEARYARKAFEQLPPLVGMGDTRYSMGSADYSIGDALVALGDTAGAEAAYRDAIRIYEELSAQSGGSARVERLLMMNYARLGDVVYADGRAAKEQQVMGMSYYSKAVGIAEKAAQADAANYTAISDLMALRARIGARLRLQKDYPGAFENLQRAHELAAQLVARDPHDSEARLNEGLTHARVAELMNDSGRAAEAIVERERVAASYAPLIKAAPNDSKLMVAVLANLNVLSEWQLKAGNPEAAWGNIAQAIALGEGMISKRPDDALNRSRLADAYAVAGRVASKRGRWEEARTWYSKAVDCRQALPAGSARDADLASARRSLAEVEGKLTAKAK